MELAFALAVPAQVRFSLVHVGSKVQVGEGRRDGVEQIPVADSENDHSRPHFWLFLSFFSALHTCLFLALPQSRWCIGGRTLNNVGLLVQQWRLWWLKRTLSSLIFSTFVERRLP